MISQSSARTMLLVSLGVIAGFALADTFYRPSFAEIRAPAPGLAPPATKPDIDALRLAIKGDIDAVRSELGQVKALAQSINQQLGAMPQSVEQELVKGTIGFATVAVHQTHNLLCRHADNVPNVVKATDYKCQGPQQ